MPYPPNVDSGADSEVRGNMKVDGNLTVGEGSGIYLTDNNGNTYLAFQNDGGNFAAFTAPPLTNIFVFSASDTSTIAYMNGNSHSFNLQNGSVFGAQDGAYSGATILFVDATNGNTNLQAHQTGKHVNILDSTGAVIATFAETNKIATFNGGQIDARTAVSNNYTILASDYIVAYTSTSSAFVATLPAAAAGNAGQTWIVKDESGGAATHNITVKTNGGTIDGVAAGTGKVINTNYGVLRVYSNGTNYFTF